MLNGTDNAAFDAIMRDLALAFDRPHDGERVRVFWEALEHVSIGEVKRRATIYRRNGKRFPAPRDLMPEKIAAPAVPISREDPDVIARANALSTWAIAANRILWRVAYCDQRRGLLPLADKLQECLRVKHDLVRLAEEDAAGGSPWNEVEFNIACVQAFENLLGLAVEHAAGRPTSDNRGQLR